MSGRELHYLQAALAEDWATPLGPDCDAFEKELQRFLRTDKPVAALQSGTAAVHLALLALGVGPGDEVIVQSMTFCASANPVLYCGATPVFVDSESDTWNISPALLDRAIADRIEKTGRKPKAIIPVALYGMPYKIREIMEVADKHGIPVVEDAAEGFGSEYDGQMLGTFGRFGVLSFNGNKMITTGGGGALVCPDEETRRHVMWLATQAREAYPYYHHTTAGFNYRLSNLCACVGRAQMEIIDERIAHHRWVQAEYERRLADLPGVTLHRAPSPLFAPNYWLCTILCAPDGKRGDGDNGETGSMGYAPDGIRGTGASAPTRHERRDDPASTRHERRDAEAQRTQRDILSGEKREGAERDMLRPEGMSGTPHPSALTRHERRDDSAPTRHERRDDPDSTRHERRDAEAQRTQRDILSGEKREGAERDMHRPDGMSGVSTPDGMSGTGPSVPVGGVASYMRESASADSDCQPDPEVEDLRRHLDAAGIESRPLWKPMHRQPLYAAAPAYTDGTAERLFRHGLCLPAGPYVGSAELDRITEALRAWLGSRH